jgi:hypothetical protein
MQVLSTVKTLAGWKLWLALVAAGAAFGGAAGVAGTSFVLGKDIATLRAEKETLSVKLESVAGSLTEQNRAVEALRQASIDQAARAAKAARKAQDALEAANARADELRHAEVPEACPDALEWLRAEVSKSATAQGETQ